MIDRHFELAEELLAPLTKHGKLGPGEVLCVLGLAAGSLIGSVKALEHDPQDADLLLTIFRRATDYAINQFQCG